MDERHDIEETLRQFRHADERAKGVKHAVMSAFADAPGREPRRPGGLWKRPVPLYAAAAVVVVMVGLSFVAGQRMSTSGGASLTPASEAPDGTATSHDIQWSRADNDLL